MTSSGCDVTVASKSHKTTTSSHVTKSPKGISNVSTFLVDINRTTPVRVRDLSTVSSVSTFMRYVSPLALSFHERSTRHKFVRNVFAALTLQFTFIMVLSLLALFLESFGDWLRTYWYFVFLACAVLFVLIFAMACIRVLRTRFPVNLIMLTLFTIVLALLLAFITAHDMRYITIVTLGLITLVCFCVMLNAMQTKHNITTWGMFMYVAVQTVVIFAIAAAVLLKFTSIKMKAMVYSVLIALTFCLYLAYDTQEILAGKRKEVTPKNVTLGVIKLYADFLYIFCLFCFLCEHRNY